MPRQPRSESSSISCIRRSPPRPKAISSSSAWPAEERWMKRRNASAASSKPSAARERAQNTESRTQEYR
jgi:hypothetical protein